MYRAQLTELLTNYGEIHEVWFDGANGEGPDGRRQEYDWPSVWSLVRRWQPRAVIFSDAGPDVRWIGNENGSAGETNWSAVDPAVVPYPGVSGAAVNRMLQHGDPAGTVWRPGETDVSIRPGWFYHPAEDQSVKSAEQLVALYFSSVGRNSKLLLNVPPTRNGLLHPTDVARLAAMRERLDSLFARRSRRRSPAAMACAGAPRRWRTRSRTLRVDRCDRSGRGHRARPGGGALPGRGIRRRTMANALERHHDRLPETRSVSARCRSPGATDHRGRCGRAPSGPHPTFRGRVTSGRHERAAHVSPDPSHPLGSRVVPAARCVPATARRRDR